MNGPWNPNGVFVGPDGKLSPKAAIWLSIFTQTVVDALANDILVKGTIKAMYGTANQPIVCTVTSLANNGQRQSTAIDNTVNLFLDALVQITIKTGASGVSSAGTVNIYAYGTANGSNGYPDGISGVDSPATLTSPPNVRLIGMLNAVANATTYTSEPMSVAAAFGGILPAHWGIVIENTSGAVLDASVGSAWYQGYQNQLG